MSSVRRRLSKNLLAKSAQEKPARKVSTRQDKLVFIWQTAIKIYIGAYSMLEIVYHKTLSWNWGVNLTLLSL